MSKAGWNLAERRSVGFEIPVDGYDAAPINGITDYCFFCDTGEVLAVIEAKCIRRDSRVGVSTDFLKYVLKIETLPEFKAVLRKAFDAFIPEHRYDASHTRFL